MSEIFTGTSLTSEKAVWRLFGSLGKHVHGAERVFGYLRAFQRLRKVPRRNLRPLACKAWSKEILELSFEPRERIIG